MKMENKRLKLKGFTLIEIIIAMILSGILVIAAMKILISISSIESSHIKSTTERNDMLLLNTILKENFMCSSKVVSDDSESVICFDYGTKNKKIFFQPSRIIIIDTLAQDSLNINYYNLKIKKLKEDTTLIEKVSFSVEHNKLIYPFFYSKEYTEDVLFNSTR